jgi:hypothetical protein
MAALFVPPFPHLFPATLLLAPSIVSFLVGLLTVLATRLAALEKKSQPDPLCVPPLLVANLVAQAAGISAATP